MSKKKMYVEMDAAYAQKMISEVSAYPDKMKTVDISEIPFNSEFPTGYTDKCQYATYATSACGDSQTNLILIYNRKDHNEMDQDMLTFYYNPKDNSPSVSGVKLPHGDYDGRTQEYADAYSTLSAMVASGFTPLSDQTKDAVEYANKYIQELKEEIEEDEKKKGQCIICRTKNVYLTDEHIIPDALGGIIHSYRVCDTCNSTLGQYVDPLLVNNFLIKFQRNLHKIPGKSGYIPNPLTAKSAIGSDGRNYRLEENDGHILPKLIPKKIEEKNGVIEQISDEYGEKDIQKAVEKFCKRNGFTIRKNTKIEINPPKNLSFKIQSILNLDDFKLPFLKIGYEFAVERIKEYFDDSYAHEISDALKNHNLSRLTKNIFRSSCFEKGLNEHIEIFVDNTKHNKHIILLDPTPRGLLCLISLFGDFSMLLYLSEKDYTSVCEPIICVNELKRDSFVEMSLDDAAKRIQQIKNIVFFDSFGKKIEDLYACDINHEPVVFIGGKSPVSLINVINSLNQCESIQLKEMYEYDLPKSSYALFPKKGMIEVSKVMLFYELNKL